MKGSRRNKLFLERVEYFRIRNNKFSGLELGRYLVSLRDDKGIGVV